MKSLFPRGIFVIDGSSGGEKIDLYCSDLSLSILEYLKPALTPCSDSHPIFQSSYSREAARRIFTISTRQTEELHFGGDPTEARPPRVLHKLLK